MTKKITQWALSVLVAIAIFLLIGRLGYYETHYNVIGRVTSVSAEEVEVTTNDGHVWAFNGEGFEEYDYVELTMFTNGTDLNKYDDEITAVKKLS